ncbi:Maf-like protein [Vibrio sp.]|uniref:dTTP/UTP pyrophosphatase n=1 Tax=Vibrio viridaestus TaxID=2487322 RepID=A0A3N9TH70_9VIBR|nr:Maf family protein [Vibrio viridaestus]MDC0611780.1 Maf-like protein [Vibrio sp.]RQW62825.1 septum formation inhibitor Maf [Vibrio viridaestus]
MSKSLILASGSPRRKELLTQLGYQFSICVPGVEEVQSAQETPIEYVQRLAESKATAVMNMYHCDVSLGADTVVVSGSSVLEKPSDFDDAKKMLMMLSGHQHQVLTAVSVATPKKVKTIVVSTDVWFKELTEQEIQNYWDSGEPQDKAGSYGIQGIGGKFVTRISGSYYAVVGLPLYETDQLLQEFL